MNFRNHPSIFSVCLRAVSFAVCAATVLLLAVAPLSVRAAEDKPNVLFLICDDLNCDLGAYGHPAVKTPNIDRLAARGTLFRNAHCQFSLCGPSRASFLTGLYPDQTLIHRNAVYIREHVPNARTLPQHFRDHGYHATRIGKLYHYNVPRHIGTGGHDDPYSWDHTINPVGRDVAEEDKIFSLNPGWFGATLSWLAADGADEEQTDGIIATEAAGQLADYAESGQPFFLAVGLFRPHTPYVAPKKYFDLYPVEDIEVPEVPGGYEESIPAPALKTLRTKKEQIDLEDSLARQAIQAYHASISFADAQLGRVLDALDQTGLADNTIVVFTSDHGYHMGEHGHWQKRTLFDNGTRVPLVVVAPGQESPGARIDMPAELVDLYPTLAELAGLEAPARTAGVSLASVLDDPAETPRSSALSQHTSPDGYSLRTERWRYTEWGENGADGVELYDHESDPEEMSNLAGEAGREETVAGLREELRRRIAEARRVPKGLKQIRFDNKRRVRQ